MRVFVNTSSIYEISTDHSVTINPKKAMNRVKNFTEGKRFSHICFIVNA